MHEIEIDAYIKTLVLADKSLKKDLTYFIEENINANPIEEEILDAKIKVKAAIKCLSVALQENLIKGPYNEKHFQFIRDYLIYDDIKNSRSEEFWNFFSYECACIFGENRKFSKELIYMQAIYNILAINECYAAIDKINCLQVADLNAGKIVLLKARGVLSKF